MTVEGIKIINKEKLSSWGASEFSETHSQEPVVYGSFLVFLFIWGNCDT